jgi:hypothetical protein
MNRFWILSAIIYLILLSSCSQAGSITTPSNYEENSIKAVSDTVPVFVSRFENGSSVEGMGAIGLFSGNINTSTLQAELTSLRNVSLTDVLEVVDITNFLNLAPCTDCAKIDKISLDNDGNVVVTIGIKHPFDAGDPLKPITGRNRADLHVFNVEGIVAIQSAAPESFPGLGKTISGVFLKNADGYTSYLDPYLDELMPTDADIHPYICHFDDYSEGNFDPLSPTGFTSVVDPPPSGNLVMPMGSDYNLQDYVFDIPGDSSIDFIFAIGCTYAVSSASKIQRFTPEYRVPQHNKKAASEVRAEVTENNLVAFNTSSTAEITVSVLDINHGVETGDSLNQMAYDSSVADILIEVPGITSAPQSDYSFVSGDGRDPLNPLTFVATIANNAGGGSGIYVGLVKVLDSYPAGSNESPLLNGMDGIKRVGPIDNPLTGLFDITEFATYTTFDITISVAEEDPVAVIVTTPDPPDILIGHPEIVLDGTGSYDPDGGSITLFEWDFDWDGVPADFFPDITGTDSIVSHDYPCGEGTYTVALRVTDDDTPSGVSLIESVEITVSSNNLPFSQKIVLGQGQTIRGSDTYHTGQSVVVDSTGLAHIITKSSAGIHYRTYDGTTMSSVIVIPGSVPNPSTISLEVDENDEIHVVWQTYQTIRHTKTTGGAFTGTVDNIADAQPGHSFSMLNMETNPNRDIMLVWFDEDSQYFGQLFYCFDTGSGFSPAALAGTLHIRYSTGGSGLMKSFRMVATPDGYFHHIFRGQTADMSFVPHIYEIIFNGSTWSSQQMVTANWVTDLAACAGSDGTIHVTGRNATTNDTEYIRFDPVTGTWLSNIVIHLDSQPWIAGPMGTIMVNPDGCVHSIFVADADDKLHVKPFCQFWSASEIQSAPHFVIDATMVSQIWGHADAEWDHDGNLLIVHENEYTPNQFEAVFNKLEY